MKEKLTTARPGSGLEEIARLKEAYANRKGVLEKILSSAKPYLEDVRSNLRDLWRTENAIIALTGTIYNGL